MSSNDVFLKLPSKKAAPFSKCLKCRTPVLDSQKGILCDHCQNWIHLKCTNLRKAEYNYLQQNMEAPFLCLYCTDFLCGKCQMPVYNHHNALFCEAMCAK